MSLGSPFLFAADLDGTLLPNTGKPARPGCLERTCALLLELRASGSPVCYVSGRHLSLARQGVGTFRLPPPDWWVCNVGTEIYQEHGAPDAGWTETLGPPLDRQTLSRELLKMPRLVMQEPQKQGPHKFSCYHSEPLSRYLLAELLDRAAAVQPGLQLVASVEESSGRALLDLIPVAAGKANAVHYLARRYGLGPDHIFFAGDSGNDLDALVSGLCGTLVGNTPQPVRTDAFHRQDALPEARLFVAEAFYGDGVIEGLRHYGLGPVNSRVPASS